jgi:hypothetical protein
VGPATQPVKTVNASTAQAIEQETAAIKRSVEGLPSMQALQIRIRGAHRIKTREHRPRGQRWHRRGEMPASSSHSAFSNSARDWTVKTPRLVILSWIVKTALILMLAGALLGASVASFLVPPMLSWYTSPGGLPQGAQIPAVVQIPEVIRYATSRLLLGQAIGGGIGAMVGLMVSFSLRRKPPTSNTASLPTSR